MSEESDWFDALPEQLREAPFFRPGEDGQRRDLDTVVTEIQHAAQHMGNSIRIPGEDAGDEAMVEFRAKAVERIPGLMVVPSTDDEESIESVYRSLGKPDTPEAYKVPDGLELDGEALGKLKAEAHGYGLTQRQFTKLVSGMGEQAAQAAEAQQTAIAEEQAAIKGEWGEAYGARVSKIAGLLAKTQAPEYLSTMITEGKLPAADMRWLYSMVESIGAEGVDLQNQGKETHGALTPEEAQDQLSELMNRADNALWDASHPDHARLVKKRVELVAAANPGISTERL